MYCLVAFVLLTKLFIFDASRGLQLDGEDGEDDDEENWTLRLRFQLLVGTLALKGGIMWPFCEIFFCLFDLAGTHRREHANALWSSTNLKGDRYIIIWGISMKAIWPADACGQCWCWCRSLYLGPLCDCVCSRALVCLQGACDGIGMSTVQPLLVCFWWPFAWICVLWVHCPLKS